MPRTTMHRALIATLAFVLLVGGAASAQLQLAEKASLSVVADRTAYAPGETVRLAVVVEIEHGWHMNAHEATLDWLIPTELGLELPEGATAGETTYPPEKLMRFEFSDALADGKPIAVYEGRPTILTELTLPVSLAGESLNVPISLHYQACDDKSCVAPVTTHTSIDLPLGGTGVDANQEIFDAALAAVAAGSQDAGPGEAAAAAAGASASPQGGSLLLLLLSGVIGGLILNAMPCVLPVLSLKIFGIVQSADQGRRHLVAGSLATAAGVLVSFWALAAVAVGARAAGNAIGWGVQFQQPGFVAFLIVVVILFSLNMWGLFEIPLPSFLGRMGGAGGGEGLGGHFASGLFATLMATPCSAPFLGPAVGFALGQPAGTIFAMFTAVGIGLALPYFLLAVFPGAARVLPKPGNWMVTLRGVLGFLLAASAVWLFFVLASQVGAIQVAFIQLAVLALALFVWLHQRLHPGSGARNLMGAAILAAAIGTIVLAIRAPSQAAGEAVASSRHDWLTFDEQEAQSLAANGQLVFVDVTADWCFTCKVNELSVIETESIDEAFDRHGVVTMKADWTNRDDAIANYLAKFERSSIPFYVLYRPGKDPHVFGELLTKGSVLKALSESAAVAELGF